MGIFFLIIFFREISKIKLNRKNFFLRLAFSKFTIDYILNYPNSNPNTQKIKTQIQTQTQCPTNTQLIPNSYV